MASTGPLYKYDGYPYTGNKSYYSAVMWYRQDKISRSRGVPLPYQALEATAVIKYGTFFTAISSAACDVAQSSGSSYREDANALNKCYSKFVSAVHDTAQIGASVTVEGREAIGMIRDRCQFLGKGFLLLKKGNFLKFIEHFGIKPKIKHKDLRWNRPHQASGLWLEYHFGWTPMVQDIYESAKILADFDPMYRKPVRAKASVSYSDSIVGGGSYLRQVSGKFRYLMQSEVSVLNQNKHLLSQMGFANPASILWEGVPFSFVVDWFSNVSTWLGSFTDFYGLELTNPMTTQSRVMKSVQVDYWNENSMEASSCFTRRTVGITMPTLTLKLLKAPSVVRAATAIALLIAVFHKQSK